MEYFLIKNFPRAIILCLQESASNVHKIRFFRYAFRGHGLKDWFRVTKHPTVALKNILPCLFLYESVLALLPRFFFGLSRESFRFHPPLLSTPVSANLCTP